MRRLQVGKRAVRRAFFCLLSVAAVAGAAPVAASDRPYLAATSAVVDEDDDRVAALETWIEGSRKFREFRFEPEYNFDPRNAVRIELGINVDRRADPVRRNRAGEIEYKHLFTDLARSGYGVGVVVAIDRDLTKANGEPSEGSWGVGTAGLLSLRPTPDTLLHLNAGLSKPRGEPARPRWAAAVEHEVVRRTSLFFEAGAVGREERLVHAGVRHWVKRERFAVDLTVGRRHGEPAAATFVTIGLALQDIGG